MRQIKVDGWKRIINPNFVNNTVRIGSDKELLELQLVFISIVMEKLLLSVTGKKLNRTYKNHPQTYGRNIKSTKPVLQ